MDSRQNDNPVRPNFDTFRFFAQNYLDHKLLSMPNRCPKCWHENIRCICANLPQLNFRDNLSFMVYMDHKEMYNAGDDAKLLMCALPQKAKRIIYPTEDDILIEHVSANPLDEFIILFPSEIAINFEEFQSYWEEKCRSASCNDINRMKLTIIVVDAVWRHARRMAQHLRDLFPNIKHVQLSPEQLSIYARTQSQPDRICTLEATSLFLSQFGESPKMCEGLIECVRLNNLALCGKTDKPINPQLKPLYPKYSRHPAWYFGDSYYGHQPLK